MNSWAAADRWATPSAASRAFSARRCRTFAAMETQKPVIGQQRRGRGQGQQRLLRGRGSGSPVVAAASAAVLVTEPGGSAAGQRRRHLRPAWPATTG